MLTAALALLGYGLALASGLVHLNAADQRAWSGLGDLSTPRSEALGGALSAGSLACFVAAVLRGML